MHLVLVDAYDSFTHNLAQSFATVGARVSVVRCDAVGPDDLLASDASLVVLGPGPGRPADAGCFLPAVRALAGVVPLLGVCLGHQALAEALGGALLVHPPVHGHAPPVHHDGAGVFAGLPRPVAMTRYHSLVVDPARLPAELRITATSDDGAVMGLERVGPGAPAWGVQFHPESVLSGAPGLRLLRNALDQGTWWVSRTRKRPAPRFVAVSSTR